MENNLNLSQKEKALAYSYVQMAKLLVKKEMSIDSASYDEIREFYEGVCRVVASQLASVTLKNIGEYK